MTTIVYDKPRGIEPAFVIIDEYESKIRNAMKCNYIGEEGQSSTAIEVTQKQRQLKWLMK